MRPSAQAVGTQGDIQPFVAVALRLREAGHRVRVATHGPLQAFVERYGLEFYNIGGDPAVLAEFAVQSKGARAPALSGTCGHILRFGFCIKGAYLLSIQVPNSAHGVHAQKGMR